MPHVWKRLGIEFPEFACGVLGEPYVPVRGSSKAKRIRVGGRPLRKVARQRGIGIADSLPLGIRKS